MSSKRTTIYHIAEKLGMSASYVSRALNDHPLVSQAIRERVKQAARELNYKHNAHAANLRRGSSRTVGVIVPHINQRFFSDAIAGIEEACFANGHGLIICQSHENYERECNAVETLVHQNVDCIFISISAETKSGDHLKAIREHGIALIQFDRCAADAEGYRVVNDNREASSKAVDSLVAQGYKKIAFLGGPEHLAVYTDRKDGYRDALKKGGLSVPETFIVDNALTREKAYSIATNLLTKKPAPDAFFTVSDHQSLGVLQAAVQLGIRVPEDLGIFGFANEAFSELVSPPLSTIDQHSMEMGRATANFYFDNILPGKKVKATATTTVVKSGMLVRKSSQRKGA